MKKITMTMAVLTLIVIDITMYKICKKLHDTVDCKISYKYIDKNGNTGKSSTCYEQDNKMYCRDVKKVNVVEQFEKEKVCK